MLTLILVSLDLTLIWFMCFSYLMAIDGKTPMIIPTVLLIVVFIITVTAIVREVLAIRQIIQENKNRKR